MSRLNELGTSAESNKGIFILYYKKQLTIRFTCILNFRDCMTHTSGGNNIATDHLYEIPLSLRIDFCTMCTVVKPSIFALSVWEWLVVMTCKWAC